MESWGEDTGERGVALGMQLGIVKWGGEWGYLRQLEEVKVLGRRISSLKFNYTALLKTI